MEVIDLLREKLKKQKKCNKNLKNRKSQVEKELKEACLHAKWLSDRLIHQYGESANYDYHIKSQAMGDKWKP